MACLRNTAISLLRLAGHTTIAVAVAVAVAVALRHPAARPDRPITLLLTS